MAVERSQLQGIDKDYIRAAIVTEQDMQKLLDEWEGEMEKAVLDYSTSSGVNDPAGLLEVLAGLTTAYIVAYSSLMDSGIANVSKVKANKVLEESLPLLRAVGDNIGAARFKSFMAKFDETVGKLWRNVPTGKYNLTFDDRLVALDLSSKKTISNIVNLGVKKQLTGQELQQILKDYVNPKTNPAKPWDIARSLLGVSKSYVPPDVLAGSVQSNMYMLTRTVQAETWRNMTEYAYKDAQWVESYDWVLSSSHPRPDVCDEYADASPYTKNSNRPFSHGHCMCDWIANLRSIKELRAILEQSGSLYNVE